jgi:lipoprotein-anchoring transpeptidase ErfK/SrfK
MEPRGGLSLDPRIRPQAGMTARAERVARVALRPLVALAGRRRLRRALVVLVVLVASLLLTAAIVDRLYAGRIAEDMRVGGVDVSGLDRAAARARLERRLVPALRRPVIVRAGGRQLLLSARAAGVLPRVDSMVASAIHHSREGWFLPRAVRALSGRPLTGRLPVLVSYSPAAVERFVHRVQAVLDRRPRNARLRFSRGRVRKLPGKRGFVLDASALRARIDAALVAGTGTRVVLPTGRHPAPAVTVAQLPGRYPRLITVDREHFKLRLFRRLHLVKAYPIAVGMIGLHTPAGLYHVHTKLTNPSWHVPNSSWAGKLAGRVIPPGPQDPLKARWIGLVDGVGIHGTDETWSLGHNASHGCIRMSIPDVVRLYEAVRLGTPVYIG